jgi:response regulator of citrate/malate metabolism
MLLSYKNAFNDLETFHVYGTCVVNQHLQTKIHSKNGNGLQLDRIKFIESIYSNKNVQGINAMSISDITGIPRATVVRKLNILVEQKHLMIDHKKHYRLTGLFVKKLVPLQSSELNHLANFSTQVFNSTIL